MNKTRLRRFISKYDFPAHLFVLFDTVVGHASTFFWTFRTKALLLMLGCHYGRNFRVDGHVIIRMARRDSDRRERGDQFTHRLKSGRTNESHDLALPG